MAESPKPKPVNIVKTPKTTYQSIFEKVRDG